MKHKDMLPLMGKIVTVAAELNRNYKGKWVVQKCPPWAGWIVGFTYKLDGSTDYNYGSEEYTTFTETGRQLCVMVKPWPTKKAIPVPLTGYKMGGEPTPPDYGGWRAYRIRQNADGSK